MAKEIELKAHVDNPDMIKEKLTMLYGKATEIHKDDIYYIYGEQPVRLRTEGGGNIVTVKQKSCKNGIEVNEELEFEVEDGPKLIKFLQMTGARPWLEKKKHGWKFIKKADNTEIVIELCEVAGLGWFIEIENVIESADSNQIRAAEQRILSVLNTVGIPEDKIEPKYYSDMILEPLPKLTEF